jgi:hypothetical protein
LQTLLLQTRLLYPNDNTAINILCAAKFKGTSPPLQPSRFFFSSPSYPHGSSLLIAIMTAPFIYVIDGDDDELINPSITPPINPPINTQNHAPLNAPNNVGPLVTLPLRSHWSIFRVTKSLLMVELSMAEPTTTNS